jgi:hypothetical protein
MSRKKSVIFSGVLVVGAVIAGSAFGATAANADPVSPPHTYVAVGSDTIQDLYNSFETSSNISSYNATLPGSTGDAALGSTITPVNVLAGTGNSIGRPNGSGDGRKALSAAWNPASSTFSQTVTKTTGSTTTPYTVTSHSIDIARSSGKPGTAVTAGGSTDHETFVPLARDAVAVATKGVTWNFTTPELEAIFGMPNDPANDTLSSTGVWTQVTGSVTAGDIQFTSGHPVLVTSASPLTTVVLNPKLPQASSGTRQFFQNAIHGTNTTPASSWVNDGNEENHADALTATGDIIPFSAAQFIAQTNGTAPDTGVANIVLDNINGSAPTTTHRGSTNLFPGALFGSATAVPAGGVGVFNRDVYSVVPTQVINGTFTSAADATYDADVTTLVTSTLPTSSNVGSLGFLAITYAATTGDWIHSNWEN